MSFEWQTEEDGWEEIKRPEKRMVGVSWQRWLFLLPVMAILGAMIWGVVRLQESLNERVTEVSEVVNGDVVTSVNLTRRAAMQDDLELFVSVLSGRDAIWANRQQEILQAGLFVDRQELGLEWMPALTQIISTTLSPDLLEATVHIRESYAIDIGNGLTDTIQLQHIETYRRGENRWLMARAAESPSSEISRYEGTVVTLSFLEQEPIITHQLGQDLDRKVVQVCRVMPELACPTDFSLNVMLIDQLLLLDGATDWQKLANQDRRGGGMSLSLPALSVIGTPVDQASYQALYRGYANIIISALITELVGWECCQHTLFYQAILDKQLHELALKPTSSQMAGSTEPISLNDLSPLWNVTDVETIEFAYRQQVYTLIELIVRQNPTVSLAEMQRQLMVYEDYRLWLGQFFVQ